jgi:hypothetical protein
MINQRSCKTSDLDSQLTVIMGQRPSNNLMRLRQLYNRGEMYPGLVIFEGSRMTAFAQDLRE